MQQRNKRESPEIRQIKNRLRNNKTADSYPDQLPLKKFYTLAETAALFLISKPSVEVLAKHGKIKYIVKPSIGKQTYRLIPLEAIEEYVRNNPDKIWILSRINRNWDGEGYSVYQDIFNHNLKKYQLKNSTQSKTEDPNSTSQETAS